jgi:hypothetical protein
MPFSRHDHQGFEVSGRSEGRIAMQLIDQGIYRLDNRIFQAHYNHKADAWTLCETEEQGAYRVGSKGRLYEITFELQTGFYDIEETPSAWTLLDLEPVAAPEHDPGNAQVDRDVWDEAFLNELASC